MKKVTLLSLVLILLAFAVVPVMADGPNNGHGHGASAGQGNNADNKDKTKQQDKNKNRDQVRLSTPGSGRNGNQDHARTRTPFYLQGTITAVNTTAKIITVRLIHGNAQVKQYLGTDLPLQASASTMVFQITQGDETEGSAAPALSASTDLSTSTNDDENPSERLPITFDQLAQAIGQKVAIHGNLVNGVYTARLITLYLQTPPSGSVIQKP